MKFSPFKRLFAGIAVAIMLSATPLVAVAHEQRDVDEYSFVVGFLNEPAYAGELNGVSVRITIPGADESTPAEPVTGLEESLQVEVTHVPSEETKMMDLSPRFGDPGHYVAHMLPTAEGTYQFRFFGTINGLEVDETFISGEGTFDNVNSARSIQFPVELAEPREMENAVRGAQDAAIDAEDAALEAEERASTASTMALVGIVAGIAGLGAGTGALVLAMRKT
ncbi:MAG: hypothetical protein WD208_09350 [Dehalococcoidia bacterium]